MTRIGSAVARGSFVAGALVLLAPAGSQAQAAPAAAALPVVLAPHRAVYDLSLTRTRGDSQIVSVRGRIVYDFSGDVCDGYTLVFRQVSEIDTGEGKSSISDLRSTSWESGDARRFKFNSQNFLDENLVEGVDGRAERRGKVTEIDLRKPQRKRFDIAPDVVFPTEHMVRAIEAGRAGKHILSFPVYDGSEKGQTVFNTLTVIGKAIPPGAHRLNNPALDSSELAEMPRWPVTISYFSQNYDEQSGEQTPDYAIGFELYANGVSRALSLDYNNFTVAGKLVSLQFKKTKPCQ